MSNHQAVDSDTGIVREQSNRESGPRPAHDLIPSQQQHKGPLNQWTRSLRFVDPPPISSFWNNSFITIIA